MKFPEHKAGLYLTHNIHKNCYETIPEWLRPDGYQADEWESAEAYERACLLDEVWELQWYPNTPVGCNRVFAPTLDEVLALALKVAEKV